MTKMLKIDLTKFKYRHVRQIPLDTTSKISLIPPVQRIQKSFPPKRLEVSELALAIGLSETEELDAHNKRYKKYSSVNNLLSGLFYLLLASAFTVCAILIFGMFLSWIGLSTASSRVHSSNLIQASVYVLSFFAIYIALQIADRISSTILNRHYADTLSFVTSIYLAIQLMFKDSFFKHNERIVALKRVRALKNNIILLAHQYTDPDVAPSESANLRFAQMRFFIQDVEKQIITPTSKTQRVTIRQLIPFIEILLSARYGEFVYKQKPEAFLEERQRQPRVVAKIFRIGIPVLFLVMLTINPNSFQFIGLDTNAARLISFAILLFAIDINLNLGIVNGVVELAKIIKELR